MVFDNKKMYEAPSVRVTRLGQEGVICASHYVYMLNDFDYGDLDEPLP